MKKHMIFSRLFKGRVGFTLTEVLLAVMIVGLISVALAALTRAAARESGVGRSKILLRNNLSSFVRTLRRDMAQATIVSTVSAAAKCSTSPVVLLKLAQNVDRSGNLIIDSIYEGSDEENLKAKYITYCFVCGTDKQNISPSGATRGGKIYRMEEEDDYPSCSSYSSNDLVLDNVKYISGNYSVPYFGLDVFSRNWTNSLLTVRIITELNSVPVMNEVIEETFAMPMGY